MNTSIRKSLTLLSLLALVIAPIGASAMTYGAPVTINNPTLAAGDRFGRSVAIDGNKFIVGAPYDDTGATDAGSAYLFDSTTGALIQTFNNPTPAIDDSFGYSVAISGDNVLIGAWSDDTGAENAGSAYLYNATTGALLQTFNNPAPAFDDGFGYSVAISGDKVLISAYADDTGAINAGSAYLFDAVTGSLLYTFNNPTSTPYKNFGISVAISGDNILIGAPYNDTGGNNAGSAYLYNATTGTLLQTFIHPTPESGDSFGWSVSVSGDNVLIGVRGDDTGAENAGSAYLYDAATGALLQTFNNPTPVYLDYFGWSVSISGDKLVIGNAYDGSVYLYEAINGALLQTFLNLAGGGSVFISGINFLVGSESAEFVYLYLADTDGDGIIDSADNCPADVNSDQADTDGDGQGNLCDFTPNGDTDNDGVDNLADNCQGIANPGQEDNDNDGIGNVCDPTPDGDPDPNPTGTDQCKNLGWMNFGFRNQGQCVAFVNTGHDSR
ncbi:MAG: thrombospondin type 3 repeat-containing protein [Parcubacteria group bacterium]|nr:thrombospondin type 3 repeat-containing protein [Parcubacteria group bacterium]